jgi:hypothetical protein
MEMVLFVFHLVDILDALDSTSRGHVMVHSQTETSKHLPDFGHVLARCMLL